MSYNHNYGYTFYFKDGDDELIFPITPPKLEVKVGSNNTVVTLINEGDINILKSPSLTDIEFEARFPVRQYPYSRKPLNFEVYYKKFSELKTNRKSFRFIVIRDTNAVNQGYGVNYLVSLEDFTVLEDASEGDDVLVSFKLKEYKPYGVVVHKGTGSLVPSTSTSNKNRNDDNRTSNSKTHKVKYGDCLWNIAKKYYGKGSKYTIIYNANKSAIEADAKKHGFSSSKGGNRIWPGLVLTIPAQ